MQMICCQHANQIALTYTTSYGATINIYGHREELQRKSVSRAEHCKTLRLMAKKAVDFMFWESYGAKGWQA